MSTIAHSKICTFQVPRLELDGRTQARLAEIAHMDSVRSVVALPDIHYKPTMESPSSCAVAATAIVPQFSSASLNCGMGVIATNLDANQLTDESIQAFFDRFNRSYISRVINKFGINRSSYDLSLAELLQVYLRGPRGLPARYRIGKETLDQIETTSLPQTDSLIPIDLDRIMPRWLRPKDRFNLGLAFNGNHFLEFQVVDEVLSAQVAQQWNLKIGQVLVMYHTGPGIGPTKLGRYYAGPRSKDRRSVQLSYFMRKLVFHMLNTEGVVAWPDRWQRYFAAGPNINQPDNRESQRLQLSMAVAMNYGYAYRMGTFARIRDTLAQLWGDTTARLVYDSAHNTIQPEQFEGEAVWVHRHNACRVRPGDPAIVSGYYNTSSYLAIGLPGANHALCTVDHGAGETIKRYEKAGLNKPDTSHQTKRYVYKHKFRADGYRIQSVDHIQHEPVDVVVRTLQESDVIAPVVRLRPVASMKNNA